MRFREIEFGMDAAEKEQSVKPHLLIEGFLDSYGYINEILNGHKFLVLGPKGSGKSAIGSKLQLMSEDDKTLFIQSHDLENFPYNAFSGILPSSEAPEIKYPLHWEFILLIALIESFSLDDTVTGTGKIDVKVLSKCLRDLGITPGKALLTDIVKTTTKKDFKIGLPKIAECAFSSEKSSEKEGKSINIHQLFISLQEACYSAKTKSTHLLIIDGLDTVFTKRELQYRSLSALIMAADRINTKFLLKKMKTKIVILCRSDLFEKLPGPNKNKIRQDSAIILDWYQDVKDPTKTNLARLINLRAKNSLKLDRELDIFTEFFPQKIRRHEPTIKTLINNTRHTPRDFIQLMNKIKDHTRGEKPTINEVKNGLRTYSIEYLLPEIRDELDGYLTTDEIENIIKLLGSMKNRRFSYSEIEKKKNDDPSFKDLNLSEILNYLFNFNIIGNIIGDMQGETEVYSWKYRNRYAILDKNAIMEVHIGLLKGLNLS